VKAIAKSSAACATSKTATSAATVVAFVVTYNREWRLKKLCDQSLPKARRALQSTKFLAAGFTIVCVLKIGADIKVSTPGPSRRHTNPGEPDLARPRDERTSRSHRTSNQQGRLSRGRLLSLPLS
jgi:hypothetical protein